MNTQRNLIEELKYQFNFGGMTVKLIFVNTVVFLFVNVISIVGHLFQDPVIQEILTLMNQTVFALNTNIEQLLLTPWGIITSIFAHFEFFHFAMNMIMLFVAGRMFEQLFNGKRLLATYLLGGIVGGVFEIVAHNIFPLFSAVDVSIVGASGSNMAIFMALAFYRPNLEVSIFGIFPLRLIILAGIFFLVDLLSIDKQDGTAHFAHIGGALLGALSIRNLHNSKNMITKFQVMIEKIATFFKNLLKKNKPKFTVERGGNARGGFKTDEEYNYEAKQRQIKVDAILDKIAKSGYESLSKAEKEFLFKQSQNGK
jgi:membrane associated rhomboid family serine protease